MTLPAPSSSVEQPRLVGAVEPQLAVRIVLEHQEAVLAGQRDQPLALGARQRHAARVLEVRDRVDQARHAARLARRLDRVDVEPVGVQVDRLDGGAEPAQDQDRAVVGRRLDDRAAAGAGEHRLRQEREALQRAVGAQHAARVAVAVARRDPLPQRRVAGAVAVGQRAGRILLERALRGARDLGDGQQVGRRERRGRTRSTAI